MRSSFCSATQHESSLCSVYVGGRSTNTGCLVRQQRRNRVSVAVVCMLTLLGFLTIEEHAFATLAPQVRDRMTTSGKVGSDVIGRLDAEGTSPVTIAFDMPEALRPTGDPNFDLAAWNAAVEAARIQLMSGLDAADFVPSYEYRSVAAIAGVASTDGILKLLDTGKVVRVDVDAIAQATLTQAVPFVHLDATQALGFTGSGVTVAVTDTGIDAQHPDFAGAIDGEECFCTLGNHGCCPNGSNRQSGAGSAAPGSVPGSPDERFHGTWTSGIIAERGVTAPRGGAPGARLFALKVLDRTGTGETSGIVAALDWVLNTRPDIKVINMSLGDSSVKVFDADCDNASAFTMMYRDVINALRSTGATVIAASGNDGYGVYMNSPACIHNAVSVAASYDNDPQNLTYGLCANVPETPDNVACFSDTNHTTDMAAPGVNITAANLGGGAATHTGTSASAPMVTACAAALREAAPALSSLELELALKSANEIHVFRSEQQYPPTGINLPRLDCMAAVNQVLAGRGLCPVSPRSTCEHSGQSQSSGFKFTAYPAPDKRDTLSWTWKRGAIPASDLGSPTDTTSYSLCVYDGASGLLVNLFAPASGVCAGKACWKPLSLGAGGFKYADRLLTPSGISFMRMNAGTSAAGFLQVKGKGQNLALPRGHVTLPVRVQLINEQNNRCWEATFTSPTVNTTGSGVPSGRFIARGQ